MNLRFLKHLLTCLLNLATPSASIARQIDRTHPMTLWPPIGDPRPLMSPQVSWIRGEVVKKHGVQTTLMTDFSTGVGPGLLWWEPQASNWIELHKEDGSWTKHLCDIDILHGEKASPSGDWHSKWEVGYSEDGDPTGYRLFVNGDLFAEENFPADKVMPTFKVSEPKPNRFVWSVLDADKSAVEFNYDWTSDWRCSYIGPLNRGDFTCNPEDLGPQSGDSNLPIKPTHPILVRVIAFRKMRRFVGYYLMGKGYVSGPKEAGAEDDLVPHWSIKDPK